MIHWFDDTPGPVTVLLHGFTGDVQAWEETFASMPRGQAVASLALPGHAPNSPTFTSFDKTCDALAHHLEAFSPRTIHLVGYSLGARLALGVGMRHAQAPARLTLIGGHIGLTDPEEKLARVKTDGLWINLLEQKGIEVFVNAWEAQPMFASQKRVNPQAWQVQHERRLQHNASRLAACLRTTGLGVMPDFRQALGATALPIHFVAGANDLKFASLGEQAHRLTPGSRFSRIDSCGHNPLLESPEALALLLCEESTTL